MCDFRGRTRAQETRNGLAGDEQTETSQTNICFFRHATTSCDREEELTNHTTPKSAISPRHMLHSALSRMLPSAYQEPSGGLPLFHPDLSLVPAGCSQMLNNQRNSPFDFSERLH